MAEVDAKGRMLIRFYAASPELQVWYEKLPIRSRSLRLNEVLMRGLGVSDEHLHDVKEVIAENTFDIDEMKKNHTTHRHQYNTLAEKVYRESDDHKQQIERMREEQEELTAHVKDLNHQAEELRRQLHRKLNNTSTGGISTEDQIGILQNKFVSMSRRLEKIESMLMKPTEE